MEQVRRAIRVPPVHPSDVATRLYTDAAGSFASLVCLYSVSIVSIPRTSTGAVVTEGGRCSRNGIQRRHVGAGARDWSTTLYLRAAFDVPEVPAYLLLHGMVLTAWFVGILLQTTLVATRRTDIHRRLGWTGAGLGVATFALSLAVTVMFVPRAYALNPNGLLGVARILWANLAALLSFAIFLSIAVVRRRQPDVHKRLMLLAAITMVQPAMARIRQMWFPDIDGGPFALVWLSLLVGTMALHDLHMNRRVHTVTLMGGMFFLGSRVFAQYVLAPSDLGLTLIRGLVE